MVVRNLHRLSVLLLLAVSLAWSGCGRSYDEEETPLDSPNQTSQEKSQGAVAGQNSLDVPVAMTAAEEQKLIAHLKVHESEGPPPKPSATGQKIKFPFPGKTTDNLEDVQIYQTVTKFSDGSWVLDGKFWERHPNKQWFRYGYYKDGKRDGKWRFLHDNGQLAKEINYVDGKEDGTWTVFRADGTKHLVRSYKNGERDGTWLSYREDGKTVDSQQQYKDGKPDGSFITYYPNGKKREENQYRDGKPNGTLRSWYENGQLQHEISIKDGKKDGKEMLFAENGRKIREIEFRDGVPVEN